MHTVPCAHEGNSCVSQKIFAPQGNGGVLQGNACVACEDVYASGQNGCVF